MLCPSHPQGQQPRLSELLLGGFQWATVSGHPKTFWHSLIAKMRESHALGDKAGQSDLAALFCMVVALTDFQNDIL